MSWVAASDGEESFSLPDVTCTLLFEAESSVGHKRSLTARILGGA